MGKKRFGYNWKARQQGKRARIEISKEIDSLGKNSVADTNYEVLPEKQTEPNTGEDEHNSRKKLSARERKRLQKIIEIKRKKSKASF